MISVVTISYNQVNFLRRCIESVISQSYTDFEYVIVDPGSSDGSRELITSFSSYFKHIIFEPDHGPSDGLNKGFRYTSGDIYCFLNSDDVFEPDAFMKINNYFQDHPLTDIVSGHSFIRNHNDCISRTLYSDRYNLFYAGFNSSLICQQSTFFRSRVMHERNISFNLSNKIAWDYEFFLDARLAGARFDLIPCVLSSFRIYPGTITSSSDLREKIKDYEKVAFKKVYKYLPLFFLPLLKYFFIYSRKIFNIRDTVERIRKGPLSP